MSRELSNVTFVYFRMSRELSNVTLVCKMIQNILRIEHVTIINRAVFGSLNIHERYGVTVTFLLFEKLHVKPIGQLLKPHSGDL